VVGLWAVGFFTPDLTKRVLRDQLTVAKFQSEFEAAKDNPQQTAELAALVDEYRKSAVEQKNDTLVASLDALREQSPSTSEATAAPDSLRSSVQKSIDGDVTYWGGVSSICIQIGAFFGMFGFGYLAQVIGRRPTFAIAFIAAAISTAAVFLFLRTFSQLFWMVPLMGFFQLSVFAGYAMYFPELFPTYLRSTGTSFCYNVGRFVAATGPLLQAQLLEWISDKGSSPLESMRYAGVIMCSVFFIGLFVLPFAPETKGKPLPE
jgi:MFS family permease